MKIIYQTETGVSILSPTGELTIAEVAAKDVPAGAPFRIVNDDEVPSDRHFRNAWYDEGGIKIDMLKAVDITKSRLRVQRTPLLLEQDVLFQRALEAGTSTAEIVSEKKRLRDVTKLADKPNITIEQLKAIVV